MIVDYIDLSDGQIKILIRVCQIYKENLGEVYKSIHQRTSDELEVMNAFGIQLSDLEQMLEKDFLKFGELESEPQLVLKLGIMELIIIRFILSEWVEDENWNDLEANNLINKLNIIAELQTTNQINLS